MKSISAFLILIIFSVSGILAQVDTTFKTPFTYVSPSAEREMKTTLGRSLILPTIIIGYGLTTIGNNGLYSSVQAQKDIQKRFGNFSYSADDYLIYAPFAEILLLNVVKYKCKNDFINTALLIVKTELLVTAITFPLKSVTRQMRPDGSNDQSFPSGHTSNAFALASIVHREYRAKSPWPGVGAYLLAGTVGAFRMLNNKHWQSDVIVGAGIGMLSAHLVYATHQYKWGRREVCMYPSYQLTPGMGMSKGMAMSIAF
jgi:membrane-associated phospholipid phosphatase